MCGYGSDMGRTDYRYEYRISFGEFRSDTGVIIDRP